MDFEKRKSIIEFLNYCEKKYDVNEWKMNGVQIWPILRIYFFFHSLNLENSKSSFTSLDLAKVALQKTGISYLFGLYTKLTLKLPKVKILFAGFESHRSNYLDVSYNKYFDPMMDELEEKYSMRSILLEYLPKKLVPQKKYRNDRVLNIYNLYYYFQNKYRNIEFYQFVGFELFLNEIKNRFDIDKKTFLAQYKNFCRNVFIWDNLWNYVLRTTEPSQVYILNYYHPSALGLILSSKRLKILSIDMQHGGQGSAHVAYSFTDIPQYGYELLPDYFWNWDRNSKLNIEAITSNSTHKSILGGNPWIEFLLDKNFNNNFDSSKDIILVTHQTGQSPILDNFLLECVKRTSHKYQWFLRLHPRTTIAEKKSILEILKKYQILEKVEIDKATHLPLPILLNYCQIHLTYYSGSAIEAYLQNVPVNIIIGQLGRKFHKELLDNNNALWFDPDGTVKLDEFIEDQSMGILKQSSEDNVSYKSNIKLLLENEADIK